MAYGVGQGLNEGVKTAGPFILAALQAKQQQKQFDTLNDRYNKAFDYQADFDRGQQGLPPLYTEEAQTNQAAATRPEVPSSIPTQTPGPLGVPQTTFPVGKPVQPMPSTASPAPTGGGARVLIPLAMRPAMSLGRTGSMGPSSRFGFGRTRY